MLLAPAFNRLTEPVECCTLPPVGIGPPRRDARGVTECEPRRLEIGRCLLEQEADREVTKDVPGQDQPGLLEDERREPLAERDRRAALPLPVCKQIWREAGREAR